MILKNIDIQELEILLSSTSLQHEPQQDGEISEAREASLVGAR